jgi:hypothetical protein
MNDKIEKLANSMVARARVRNGLDKVFIEDTENIAVNTLDKLMEAKIDEYGFLNLTTEREFRLTQIFNSIIQELNQILDAAHVIALEKKRKGSLSPAEPIEDIIEIIVKELIEKSCLIDLWKNVKFLSNQ